MSCMDIVYKLQIKKKNTSETNTSPGVLEGRGFKSKSDCKFS